MNPGGEPSMAVSTGPVRRSGPEQTGVALNGLGERTLVLVFASLALPLLLATSFFSFIVPQTPGRLGRATADLIPQFSLWSWLASPPLPVPATPVLVAASLLLFIAVAFAAYGAALYLSWERTVPTRLLLIVAAMGLLFSFTNVWSLPNLNTDIYNYIMRGRVAAVYGENPYGVAADQFPDDPLYRYASPRYTAQPGGKLPVWMALNVLLARLAGHNPLTNLLTYRLVLFLFNAANLALLILIVRTLHAPHALATAVLYSWNPIVILLAQSKTDTVMVSLMLLAVWFLVNGHRWWLPFTLLVLSALVKLITVPLLAVYLVRSLKLKRWTEFAGSVLVGVVLAGSTFLLLYFSADGGQQVQKYVVLVQKGGSSTPYTLRNVVRLAFVAVTVVAGLMQNGTHRRLLGGWAVVMLFFSLFITRFSLSWYLITPIAIVALVSDWRMALLTLALSFSSFLFNTWDTTFTNDFPPPTVVNLPRFLLYLALPTLVAAYVGASTVWRRFRA